LSANEKRDELGAREAGSLCPSGNFCGDFRPDALLPGEISFKQGANGDEDFAAPERKAGSLAHRLKGDSADLPARVWERNKGRHNEICDTLQPGVWGYKAADDGKHRTPDEVMKMLADADAARSTSSSTPARCPTGRSILPTSRRCAR
jgi:hypothetical protein